MTHTFVVSSWRWKTTSIDIFRCSSYNRLAELAFRNDNVLAVAWINRWEIYGGQAAFRWFCLGTKDRKSSLLLESIFFRVWFHLLLFLFFFFLNNKVRLSTWSLFFFVFFSLQSLLFVYLKKKPSFDRLLALSLEKVFISTLSLSLFVLSFLSFPLITSLLASVIDRWCATKWIWMNFSIDDEIPDLNYP